VKTITIRGVRYTLTLDEVCDEYIETPERKGKKRERELYVNANLRGRRIHLIKLCHAGQHAVAPTSPEPWVEMAGDAIGRLVWAAGYRLKEEK
jgi:hypothetical protein